MNSIECLWGVIKRDFKSRMIQHKHVTISQKNFENLLQESLEDITVEAQHAAARHNNRHFLHQCLGDLLLAMEHGEGVELDSDSNLQNDQLSISEGEVESEEQNS